MPRRAQLALALILVLTLVPLAGASCGVRCLATVPRHSMPASATQQACVRGSACCHSTGPAICSAAQAPGAMAALLSSDASATHEVPALGAIGTQPLPQDLRALAGSSADTSPPGRSVAITLTPLRV